MFFPKKTARSFIIFISLGIFLCVFPKHVKSDDKPDFGDYPEDLKQYFHYLFRENQHKHSFRNDYPRGFDVWQKKTRPIL